MELVLLLVWFGSAVWVFADASSRGLVRGEGFLDMGPTGWAFAVLLLWLVTFPLYLSTRSRDIGQRRAPTATVGTVPTTPPAGWYDDPSQQGRMRWWDGVAWSDHTHTP